MELKILRNRITYRGLIQLSIFLWESQPRTTRLKISLLSLGLLAKCVGVEPTYTWSDHIRLCGDFCVAYWIGYMRPHIPFLLHQSRTHSGVSTKWDTLQFFCRSWVSRTPNYSFGDYYFAIKLRIYCWDMRIRTSSTEPSAAACYCYTISHRLYVKFIFSMDPSLAAMLKIITHNSL